jgi:hypothetical protein
MGLEATCTARVGRKTSTGKALLETTSLIFRGDFSFQIAFAAMRDVTLRAGSEGVPVVFFGAETRDALRHIPRLRARMPDSGALWVVRPKGSKEIAEGDVFAAGRAAGLVDTKVVAFSSTHTAHKWVVPVEQRVTKTKPVARASAKKR